MMQKWTRNIHLLIGLLCLPFLLMYSVSAVQMAHNKWFKNQAAITKTSVALKPEEASDGRAVGRALIARGVVRGDINRAEATPNGFKLRVVRPGTVSDVVYDRATGQAAVQTATSSFMLMMNRLHHLAGVRHEYGVLNAWGWALGLTGLLLMGLAATGIYLWFQMHAELVIGTILLVLSLGYSLSLIYALRITS